MHVVFSDKIPVIFKLPDVSNVLLHNVTLFPKLGALSPILITLILI